MRRANIVIALVSLLLGDVSAHAADSGPVIVLPGRHHLPVIINGVDATGAVVEGDFGLYSPHMINPVIIPAPYVIYRGAYYGGYVRGSYFPAFGREPGYGRHEIIPPADRPLPPRAPSFHRSWSTHSDPLPANLEPQAQTPLILAPQIYPSDRRDGGRPR